MTWLDAYLVILGAAWFAVALYLDRKAEREMLARVEALYRKDADGSS